VRQSERLVGREHDRDVLAAALDVARHGDGQFLLISGEAGIGKSALLSWAVDRAEGEFHVLRGFCFEGSGVPPYWPWTQVLRESGLARDRMGKAAQLLGADSADTYGAIGLREADAGALRAGDARFQLLDSLGRCLADIARDRPLLVALDDVHWADEQSLTALAFVTRALATQPAVVIAAYRDNEAPASVTALADHAQHLPLNGLELAEVEAMITALPGVAPTPERTAAIWRRSGGNPFFVREMTRLLQAQGVGQLPTHLPESIVETVRRRLARLPTECVRFLEWAAVAGRDIDATLLVRSGAAADETTVRELLDHARRAGVVVDDDPPRFAHDLFREAILHAQPAAANAAMNLAVGRALQQDAVGGAAARIAAHLLRAGPSARDDAIDFSILAAAEATARLGHDDAVGHYLRAVGLLDERDERFVDVLLGLAAAQDRAGAPDAARQHYREVADVARRADDSVTIAHAALGLHGLGNRSGAQNTETLTLLGEAARRLEETGVQPVLHSRVLAATTRELRHGTTTAPRPELAALAHRAIELAQAGGDHRAIATAQLALHDAIWTPGTAASRLLIADDIFSEAQSAGDADLVAVAHQLRAAALLELGDPAGRDELLVHVAAADALGHARGHWCALTRKATYAQIAGRAEEAARLGEQALAVGQAIGEPDAIGCFATSRYSLVALGARESDMLMDGADPLWPMFPLFSAWPFAVRGEHDAAREALGNFSVLDVVESWGLESLAVTAVVFAAVGTDEQRRWVYDSLTPHAGTHVVVGGCASYHAAVDHHLGVLAASLGDRAAAEAHFRAAIALHRRLGAAGWERITEQALADLLATDAKSINEIRFVDGVWTINFAGTIVHLPDAKGLRDLAVLLAAKGEEVHVLTLIDPAGLARRTVTGADPVLDDQAKAQFKARLQHLAARIADADEMGHSSRAASLADERDALIHELAVASGLRGRTRRLNDETERARKTVGARLRDTLGKIDHVHPELGEHLRNSLRMGTTCSYAPAVPTTWRTV
jgi:tetratricopeptide (TPR) repeat protein